MTEKLTDHLAGILSGTMRDHGALLRKIDDEPTLDGLRARCFEDNRHDGVWKEVSTTNKIRQWAVDRNLHTADPTKQALKLGEEFGELFEGLAKGNEELTKDAIGDMYVVMTILSEQLGFSIEGCIDIAYDEIKDRKGRMIDGVFVKESDLKEDE